MTDTAPEPATDRDGPPSALPSRLYRTQRPTPAAASGLSPDPWHQALSPAPEPQSLLLSLLDPSWCAAPEQVLSVRRFRTGRTASGSRCGLFEAQCATFPGPPCRAEASAGCAASRPVRAARCVLWCWMKFRDPGYSAVRRPGQRWL